MQDACRNLMKSSASFTMISLAQTEYIPFFFRYSIFKVHLKPLKTDLDLAQVARKMAALTPGFTGLLSVRFHPLHLRLVHVTVSSEILFIIIVHLLLGNTCMNPCYFHH